MEVTAEILSIQNGYLIIIPDIWGKHFIHVDHLSVDNRIVERLERERGKK